jgi:hypothetical protein
LNPALVGLILMTEVAVLDVLYGVGARFGGSWIYGLLALGVVVVAGAVVSRLTGYFVGAALSVVAFCAAMAVAVNLWGT